MLSNQSHVHDIESVHKTKEQQAAQINDEIKKAKDSKTKHLSHQSQIEEKYDLISSDYQKQGHQGNLSEAQFHDAEYWNSRDRETATVKMKHLLVKNEEVLRSLTDQLTLIKPIPKSRAERYWLIRSNNQLLGYVPTGHAPHTSTRQISYHPFTQTSNLPLSI